MGLAMPAAMSSMGVFAGVCVIIFAGFTAGMGLYFLSRCALRIERGHSSFFAVAKRTYPEASIVFDSAITIKCFGPSSPKISINGRRRGSILSYYNRRFDAPSSGEYLPRIQINAVPPRQTILDYVFHVLPSLYSGLIQVDHNPVIVSETIGFVEVYFYCCLIGFGISCINCRRTFLNGRYT